MVGKIWVNGKDPNREQVRLDMAWVYAKYASELDYFAAEQIAKGRRTGQWAQPNATPSRVLAARENGADCLRTLYGLEVIKCDAR
jgi:endonuclease YncB( thermonuclease family)